MKNTSMNMRQLNLLSVGLLQVIEINERIFFVNLRSFTFSTIGNFFDIYLKHLFSVIFTIGKYTENMSDLMSGIDVLKRC